MNAIDTSKTSIVALMIGFLFLVEVVAHQTSNARGVDSSLGQLTKRAQAVVVGEVVAIETNETGGISIRLQEAHSILGVTVSPVVTFELGTAARPYLAVGDRVLAFVSSEKFDAENFQSFRFDYYEELRDDKPRYVMAGLRGLIAGDDSSVAGASEVVSGYWQQLREEPRNPFEYAAFLNDLLTNGIGQLQIGVENDRIRVDAESDLRILVRYSDIPTIERLLRDEAFPPHIHAHIERILQWKVDGEPRVVRDWQPTDDDWIRWISLLESESRADNLAALAELSQPERRDAVLQSIERWQEGVAALLGSSEDDVRIWAAVLLSSASDERALIPLVGGLQSDVDYRRKAAWEALEQMSEGDAPSFDPDASPEVRRQAIERIKEWAETK